MTVSKGKMAISTIACLLILICLVTHLTNAQSSVRNGYIDHGEITAHFKPDGNAIVTENIYYVFSEPADTLLVPLVTYKLVNPTIPVDLAVWTNVLLNIRNGRLDLVYDDHELTLNFSGIYSRDIAVSLPVPSANVTASLTYEVENIENSYPFLLSGYEVRLDPMVQARSFSFTIVFDSSMVGQPLSLYLDSGIQLGSREVCLPNERLIENNSILVKWNLLNLTSIDYPLRATTTISGLPGMAFGGTLIFSDITAVLLAFSFEVVYYLSILPGVGPYVKLRRKIALSARVHPLLMLLALTSWLVTDLVLRVPASQWAYSWIWPIHLLAFNYWALMLIFWPSINLFDYVISRRKKTLIETTGARFTLWIKRVPRLLAAIFLHGAACYLFLVSMIVLFFDQAPLQGQLFFKEPWFFAITSTLLALTSFLLFKIQNSLVKQQETVNVVFKGLLDHTGLDSVTENALALKCKEKGISAKSTKLAVESLDKIDGLICQKEGKLRKLRDEIFVPQIDDPSGDIDVIDETERLREKLEKFKRNHPETRGVRIAGSPSELFDKNRITNKT